ncbi:MAG: hypothetical protein Q4B14_05375 [Clostridia bacterium]|nr:hypothetical protein [Clostridia bacterium]
MKKRKMKKVFSMRLSSMLLVLSILTTCVAAGTFAASGDTLGMYGYSGFGYEYKVLLNDNESIIQTVDNNYVPSEYAYWDIFSSNSIETAEATAITEMLGDTQIKQKTAKLISVDDTIYGKIVLQNLSEGQVAVTKGQIVINAYYGEDSSKAEEQRGSVPFRVYIANATENGEDVAIGTVTDWTELRGASMGDQHLLSYNEETYGASSFAGEFAKSTKSGGGKTLNDNSVAVLDRGETAAVWVKFETDTEDYATNIDYWRNLSPTTAAKVNNNIGNGNGYKPGFKAQFKVETHAYTE